MNASARRRRSRSLRPRIGVALLTLTMLISLLPPLALDAKAPPHGPQNQAGQSPNAGATTRAT